MIDRMKRAKAFVFAAEEDFGITVVEAQTCGTPVIAFGKGGALETINGLDHDQPTGIFFKEQTVDALVTAVSQFEKEAGSIDARTCRENALRFSPERFREEFSEFVEVAWDNFKSDMETA
jgi:glycosyltransferase involved in cell wall biosynthesis